MNTVGSARRKEAMHALNPFAPGAGRQPKELVGREQELEIMDRIIARTKAGYSDRGLVYSGLRGVGKTVLLLRMKDMAASQGLITVRMEATGNEAHDYELLFGGISKAILRERRGTLRQKMLDSLKHVNEVSLELGVIKTSIGLGNEGKGISSDSLRLEMMVEELCRELKKEGSGLFLFIDEFQVMSSDLMGTIIGLQHSMGQEDLPFYVIAAGLPNLPGVLTKSRSYAERLFQYKRIGVLGVVPFSWTVIRGGDGHGEVHEGTAATRGRVVCEIRGLRGGCDPRAGVSQPGGVAHVAPGLARRTGDGRVLAAW